MKQWISIIGLLLLMNISDSYAQVYNYIEEDENKNGKVKQDPNTQSDKVPLRDKLFFGGNVGFQFGDVTLVNLAPLIGYKITPQLHSGVVFSYTYYKDKRFNPTFNQNIIGGRIFARYIVSVTEQLHIFPHLEFQTMRYETRNGLFEVPAEWYNSVLPGIGIQQRIGQRSAINIYALYDLNYNNDTSIYDSPWVFRVEFNI
ncbi:hypothetical protein V6R21_31750 [Limibacter armeniacum]|uniref:hypothetical protein n=1 Tax=Limibacter armeniacum TaxID=466084 RepID=UPI002FE6C1B5